VKKEDHEKHKYSTSSFCSWFSFSSTFSFHPMQLLNDLKQTKQCTKTGATLTESLFNISRNSDTHMQAELKSYSFTLHI